MAKYYFTSPTDVVIDADNDTSVSLPNPNAGGGPLAVGVEFTVCDNLGLAGSHNIAIVGPVGASTTGTSITTNYGSTVLTWTGNSFVQK